MKIDVPSAGHYEIVADRSKIDFAVKHRFGTGTVRGRFAVTGGVLVVAEPITESSVSVSADPASFDSGNKSRDAKIRSGNFLDSNRYPTITFNSGALAPTTAGLWELVGTLNAHGVLAKASFILSEARCRGETVDLSAIGTVDRYDHGVRALKGMAGRRLDLTITLSAIRTEPA